MLSGKICSLQGKNPTPSTFDCRNTTTFWPKPKIFQLEMLPGYQSKSSLKPQWVWALPPVRRYLPWNTTFWGPWDSSFLPCKAIDWNILIFITFTFPQEWKPARQEKQCIFLLKTLQLFQLMAEEQLEANATSSGIQSCCNYIGFTVKL